jgi:hypothetical protein
LHNHLVFDDAFAQQFCFLFHLFFLDHSTLWGWFWTLFGIWFWSNPNDSMDRPIPSGNLLF